MTLTVFAQVLIGAAFLVIALVLGFDRAAATRLMFDNRRSFGAFIGLCGAYRLVLAARSFHPMPRVELVLVIATCAGAVVLGVRAALTARPPK